MSIQRSRMRWPEPTQSRKLFTPPSSLRPGGTSSRMLKKSASGVLNTREASLVKRISLGIRAYG